MSNSTIRLQAPRSWLQFRSHLMEGLHSRGRTHPHPKLSIVLFESSHSVQTAYTWAPLAFFLFTGLLIAIGLSGPLHYLFPVFSLALAWTLYRKAPVSYVTFVWWLWFLAPFVRRVVDFRSGWMDPSPILLAPPLASLACLPTLFEQEGLLWRPSTRPFLLALASTIYGICIGLLKLPAKTVLTESLSWLAPLIFGFYLYSALRNTEQAEQLENAIGRTFCWGTLGMSIYGLWQFATVPAWDALWISHADMTSIGVAEPFGVRVFSTMNSPGPFGVVLVAGLIFLALKRTWIARGAALFGYLTLALTSVRSAWLALLVGFIAVGVRRREFATKLLAVPLVLLGCYLLLSSWAPANEIFQTRMQTFTEIQNDTSYLDRSQGFSQMMTRISHEPVGGGIGIAKEDTQMQSVGAHDNALIELLMSLGWLGGATYLTAILFASVSLVRHGILGTALPAAASSVALGIIAQSPFGSAMLGVSGMVLWNCIACGLTAVETRGRS